MYRCLEFINEVEKSYKIVEEKMVGKKNVNN
jgi:hypothetical protein